MGLSIIGAGIVYRATHDINLRSVAVMDEAPGADYLVVPREAGGASVQATMAGNHPLPPFLQILGIVYNARSASPDLGALAGAGERWMSPGKSHV